MGGGCQCNGRGSVSPACLEQDRALGGGTAGLTFGRERRAGRAQAVDVAVGQLGALGHGRRVALAGAATGARPFAQVGRVLACKGLLEIGGQRFRNRCALGALVENVVEGDALVLGNALHVVDVHEVPAKRKYTFDINSKQSTEVS